MSTNPSGTLAIGKSPLVMVYPKRRFLVGVAKANSRRRSRWSPTDRTGRRSPLFLRTRRAATRLRRPKRLLRPPFLRILRTSAPVPVRSAFGAPGVFGSSKLNRITPGGTWALPGDEKIGRGRHPGRSTELSHVQQHGPRRANSNGPFITPDCVGQWSHALTSAQRRD